MGHSAAVSDIIEQILLGYALYAAGAFRESLRVEFSHDTLYPYVLRECVGLVEREQQDAVRDLVAHADNGFELLPGGDKRERVYFGEVHLAGVHLVHDVADVPRPESGAKRR